MKITPSKIIGYAFLLVVVFVPIVFGADIPTGADISNLSPVFSATPSDGGSVSTTPTNAGSSVTFTATAKDVNSDQYYLAICKTDSVTAGANTYPTCDGGKWPDANPTAVNSDAQATETYTAQSGDAESNAWYAFVCDKLASGAACHPANGRGDQGKALGIITFTGVPVDGATLTIDSIVYEFDTANNGVTGGRTEVDTSVSVNGSNAATNLALAEVGTSSSMIARGTAVYVYADAAGVAGNSIGMAEAGDSGNVISLSGATLSGGSDANASPFHVNHAPTFGTVTVTDSTGGTVEPGDLVKFTLAHPGQIADADTNPSQDTLGMYICTGATTSFNYSTNACTGGTSVCSDVGVNPATTDATCTESSPNLATLGTVNFKVYVKDVHSMPGIGTNAQSFTTLNTAPTHDTPELDVHSPVLATSAASWQFEDGASATSFDDETTNANNGACTDCPTWTQSGFSGGAYGFNGVSNAITVGDTASLRLTTKGSVAFWVKLNSAPAQFGNIFDKGNWGGGRNYYSCYFQANDFRCDTGGSSTSVGSVATTSMAQFIGNWKHVVFTWDGSKQYLYVNGAKEDEDTQTQTPDTTGYGFNIGRGSYSPNGTIDELNVYNRTLSASEITALYNAYTTPGTSAYTTSNMDLSAKPVNIVDAESDPTTVIYNWKKNGTAIAKLVMPFDTNTAAVSANAILDYSGNASHGTLGGGNATYAPTWTSAGIKGGAYSFDGVDDYITLGNPTSFQSFQSFTFSAWVKTSVNAHKIIVSRYDRTPPNNLGFDFLMQIQTDNKVHFYLDAGTCTSDNTVSRDGISNVSDGQWHMVTGVYNAPAQTLKLYVDGVEEAGTLTGTVPASIQNCSDDFEFGSARDSLGGRINPFNGLIDEARFYDSALTDAQVAQDYNNKKPLYNTIVRQQLSSADSSWVADVTINDAQTSNSNSITKSTNAIDPSNSAPDQNFPVARSHAPLDPNSVAYFQLEDGIGATAFDDETTNNNNGSCTNCPTWTPMGVAGGAYSFDGTNDAVNLTSPISFDDSDDFTLSLWYKGTDTAQNGEWGKVLMGRDNADLSSNFVLRNGYVEYTHYNGSWNHNIKSSTMVADGLWHHLVYMNLGSTQNGYLWVDGVREVVAQSAAISGNPFRIDGLMKGYNGAYTSGMIDEVHVYNRSLTISEVANLYASQSYVYDSNDLGVTPQSLADNDGDAMVCSADWRKSGTSLAVLNLPFNENVTSATAGAVKDMSTYANNATLGGGNASYVPTWTNAAACGNNSGGCYAFDGADDYIDVPSLDLRNYNKLTFSAWVNFGAQATSPGDQVADSIITQYPGSTTGFLFDDYDGGVGGSYNDGLRLWAEGTPCLAGDGALAPNVWSHVAATYDKANGDTYLYVNGSQVKHCTLPTSWSSGSLANASIGHQNNYDSQNANGKIDEFQVFDRILSPSQILTMYNAGKANYQNLANAETLIGDLFTSSLMCSDANGSVSAQLTSNSVEILGFSTDVSDGGVTTNVGSVVTFTGTYNAVGGRQWYLAVCKTNSATPGSDAAPTCDGGAWAISSATSDGAQASVNYTAQSADATSNAWYAFGCDKVASVASCSPMTQGSGNNGSPFVVNHAPALGTVAIGPTCGSTASVDPGNARSFKLTTPIGSSDDGARGGVFQSDGKYVSVGYSNNGSKLVFAVVRTNADGTLDTTFNTTGKATTPFAGSEDTAYSAAIQSDGKIVAVGYTRIGSHNDLALARYNADGSLDTAGFGSGTGKVTTTIGTATDNAWKVFILPDQKILVGGRYAVGSDYHFFLARYNSDGTLDNSFGTGGKATTAITGGNYNAYYAVLKPDGKIVAVGDTTVAGYSDFIVVQYNSDGSLDTANFGSGTGKVTTSVGSGNDQAWAVAIQSDGKIVVGGNSHNGSNDDFALVRYNSDGSLDTTGFGTGGKVTTAIGSGIDKISKIAIQADGKVVVAGYTHNGTNYDFALARYTTAGALDSSFNSTGKATMDHGYGNDLAVDIGIQSDGRIVVPGQIGNASNADFGLVRYKSDGSVDDLSGYACASAPVTDSDTNATVDVHFCSTNSFTGTACSATTYCKITGVKTGDNAQCVLDGRVPIPTSHGSKDVYVFTVDNNGFQGTGTSTQSYTVTDVPPTLGTYTVADISPLAGASTPTSFTVTISDNNGGGDVVSASGAIYDDTAINLSSGTCTPNEANCYTSSACSLGTPGSTSVTATCGGGTPAPNVLATWFNINPTSAGAAWKAHVNFADETTSVTNASDSNAFTVATLSAVSIPETGLPYGPLAVGGTSATSLPMTMQNVGNVTIDVGIRGSDMCTDFPTCSTSGGKTPISRSQQHWANSSSFAYGTGDYPLVAQEIVDGSHGAADGCANRSISVRPSHESTSTDSLIYWRLRIPTVQSGSYSGVNTVTSVADGLCVGTD